MQIPDPTTLYETRFRAGDTRKNRAATVQLMQKRYRALQEALGHIGSYEASEGTTVTDPEIPPHDFIEDTTCYTFPRQETAVQVDIKTTDNRPDGYSATRYRRHYSYDPSKVTGYVQITCNGFSDPPVMSAEVMTGSEIPPEAAGALALAFEGLPLAVQPA